MGRLCCCYHNCSFYCTSSTQRDPFVAHLSQLWSDSLSSRSLLIHSRMYRPQFFSLIESASHFSRNLTASPSTDLRSVQSKTIRLPFVSAAMSATISVTFSAVSCPLTLKTTSPFAFLVILSICLLVDI